MSDFDELNIEESGYYKDSIVHNSPVGKLIECFHTLSNERRSLKVVNREFIQKHDFFKWFTATLSIAGQTAREFNKPHLISPIQNADGNWFTLKNGAYIIERLFIGSPESPAYNINQFIDHYFKHDDAVDEDVALSLMYMIVSVLDKMHDTKFESSEISYLSGIPHLNLKPENVIIGLNNRSNLFEVYLTDHIIAMASPIAEENGIKATLNYCDINILKDNYYYNKKADIFSCGLLLYKLLEKKDLIPGEIGRKSVIAYIENELPEILKKLRLTKAKKTLPIILHCLTEDSRQRYPNIKELKLDLSNKLKLSSKKHTPSEILRKQLEGKKSDDQTKPPAHNILKKVLYSVMALSIVIGGFWGYMKYNEWRDQKEFENQKSNVQKTVLSAKDISCVSSKTKDEFQSEFNKAKTTSALNQLDRKIKNLATLCDSLNVLEKNYHDFESKSSEIYSFFNLQTIFITFFDSASYFLRQGDISTTTKYLAHVDNSLQNFEDSLKTCSMDGFITEYENIISDLHENCKERAQKYFEKAKNACLDGNLRLYAFYKDSLDRVRNDNNCFGSSDTSRTTDPIKEIKNKIDNYVLMLSNNCKKQADSIIQLANRACENYDVKDANEYYNQLLQTSCIDCEDELIVLTQAKAALSNFEIDKRNRDIPFENCTYYLEAKQYITKAENAAITKECDKIEFNANSALNIVKDSYINICQAETDSLLELEKCVLAQTDDMSNVLSLIDGIKDIISQCNCDAAYEQINNLKITLTSAGIIPCNEGISDNSSYISCENAYFNGDINAWEICKNVSKNDRSYGFAMKYYILSIGRNEMYQSTIREDIKLAAKYSDHDIINNTPENARVYITLALVFGWDKNNIDYKLAHAYYDSASSMGDVVLSIDNWWQAKLVEIRCLYNKLKNSRTQINIDKLAKAIFEFKSYVENIDIPNKGNYILEIESYWKEIE